MLENGKQTSEEIYLQIATHCLKDKQYYIKEYGALLIKSAESSEIFNTHKNRILYKNKLNIQEIANELNVNKTTIQRNIKRLEKLNFKILKIENTLNGIAYCLPSENNIDTNKFVTIRYEMLKKMVNNFKSNTMKVYFLLKIITTETNFESATNSFIAENIGLSSKSKNNLDIITSATKILEEHKYIETKKVNVYEYDKEKLREVPKIRKVYRICNFDE
ncbi:TPA: helix-turn-helix domain-containing protein [Clostridioides difficile]|nr:helix-turn-helix domain-containing protein [Clostridioides difficile]HBG1040864.1 helix-turn-helix domain-containing protein [Clostridioides difficile]HCQ5573994.1 helix-turn-helix domain-containing protein [Clostridioides difficile]